MRNPDNNWRFATSEGRWSCFGHSTSVRSQFFLNIWLYTRTFKLIIDSIKFISVICQVKNSHNIHLWIICFCFLSGFCTVCSCSGGSLYAIYNPTGSTANYYDTNSLFTMPANDITVCFWWKSESSQVSKEQTMLSVASDG